MNFFPLTTRIHIFSLKQQHRLRILHEVEHHFLQRWIPIRYDDGGEDVRLEEFICYLMMSFQCTTTSCSI